MLQTAIIYGNIEEYTNNYEPGIKAEIGLTDLFFRIGDSFNGDMLIAFDNYDFTLSFSKLIE